MGGTFDPIHNGHLIIAENSRVEFKLDEIIFIPAGKPAHKIGREIESNRARYQMVLLAIGSNPYFSLSSMELEKQGTSYTIETIKSLQKANKNTDYYFIMGEDSLYQLHKWKAYKELLTLCKFIVAKRLGLADRLKERLEVLNKLANNSIYLLEAPLVDISSTTIRERINENRSIKYLLPGPVEEYIRRHGLYGGGDNEGLDF